MADGSETAWPSERLMTRMPYLERLAIAQSMPAITSLVYPTPVEPRTRTSINLTAGALPPANAEVTRRAADVLPPMAPATCVPWPYGSPVEGASHDTRLTRATTRVSSAECGAIPESRTATPMPFPLYPALANRPSRLLVPCHISLAPVT